MAETINSKDLDSLLETLKKGLAVFGLNDLNKNLQKVIYEQRVSSKIVKCAIEIIIKEYKIDNQMLVKGSGAEMTEARNILCCILFYKGNLSIREISGGVLQRTHHYPVTKAIKRHRTLDVKIPQDREYKEKYDKIENKILKTIKNGD